MTLIIRIGFGRDLYEEMGAPYLVGIIEKKLEGLQAEAEE
jgi:hypothetical protein